MGKLSAAQIDEYFDTHLPYRTGILLAHYRMTHDPSTKAPIGWFGDVGQLNACFVASLVTGRLFLNLLGIGKDSTGKLCRFNGLPDDVNSEDLGGKFIDLSSLATADEALFTPFIKMADKAAAHFILPMTHDVSKTHDVILRIHHYLKVNLYEHTGRPFKDLIP
jgi:hypothetical protein